MKWVKHLFIESKKEVALSYKLDMKNLKKYNAFLNEDNNDWTEEDFKKHQQAHQFEDIVDTIDEITLNLRAFDDNGIIELENLLRSQLELIEDVDNEEALEIIQKFKGSEE